MADIFCNHFSFEERKGTGYSFFSSAGKTLFPDDLPLVGIQIGKMGIAGNLTMNARIVDPIRDRQKRPGISRLRQSERLRICRLTSIALSSEPTTIQPGTCKSLLRLIITVVRPGKGRPMDS